MRRDAAHALSLRRPVAEHGAVEQLGERLAAEPGLLRERGGRVLAHDPGHVVIHHPGGVGPVGGLQGAHPLGLDRGGSTRVVGRLDEDHRVGRSDLVAEQWRRLGEDLQRHLLDPAERLGQEPFERDAEERVGAAPADRPAQLLEQRPGLRVAADEHLPARLDLEAVGDDQLGVRAVARVGHRLHANAVRAPSRTSRRRSSSRARPSRRSSASPGTGCRRPACASCRRCPGRRDRRRARCARRRSG